MAFKGPVGKLMAAEARAKADSMPLPIGGRPLPALMARDQMWSDPYPTPYRGPLDLVGYGGETPEMRAMYREFFAREPAVFSAIRGKVAAVASLDVAAIPEDQDDPEDCRAAEFVKWAVEKSMHGWDGLTNNTLEPSTVDGWSVGEIKLKVLDRSDTKKWAGLWGLEHVRSIDTTSLRLQLDQFRNIRGIVQTNRGLQDYDPEKVVLFTHLELFSNPFGRSSIRAAFRNASIIEDAYYLWLVGVRIFGAPFLTGKTAASERKAQMENALAAARAAGYLVCHPDDDVAVLNLASATSFDAFEKLVEKSREEIYLAIRGAYLPFMQGQGGGDSRGDSGVSKHAGSDPDEYMLAKAIGRCFTRQLVPHLVRPNFPNAGMPTIVFGGVNWAETKQQLDVAEKVSKLVPVSKKWVYEFSQAQPPSDPDDAVGGPQTPPGGPGSPPGPPGLGSPPPDSGGPPPAGTSTPPPAETGGVSPPPPSDTFADAASPFPRDLAARYADYFAASQHGHFPGDMHEQFGMTVPQFADLTKLRRKQIRVRGTGPAWVWAGSPAAAVVPPSVAFSERFADDVGHNPPHPGLVYNPGDHRYHKPSGSTAASNAPPKADDKAASAQPAGESTAEHPVTAAVKSRATAGIAAAAKAKTREEFSRLAQKAAADAYAAAKPAAKAEAKAIGERFVAKYGPQLESLGVNPQAMKDVVADLQRATVPVLLNGHDRRDEIAHKYSPDNVQGKPRSELVASLTKDLVGSLDLSHDDWNVEMGDLMDTLANAGVHEVPEPPQSASDDVWNKYEADSEKASKQRNALAFAILARWADSAGWAEGLDKAAQWASVRQFSDAVDDFDHASAGIESMTFADGASLVYASDTKQPANGRKTDVLGRVRCYVNGKQVACHELDDSHEAAKPRAEAKQIAEAHAKGAATPEQLKAYAGYVRNMTSAELKQFQKDLYAKHPNRIKESRVQAAIAFATGKLPGQPEPGSPEWTATIRDAFKNDPALDFQSLLDDGPTGTAPPAKPRSHRQEELNRLDLARGKPAGAYAPKLPPMTVPTHRENGTPVDPKNHDVHTVPTSSLKADPDRFQYKVSGIGSGGVGQELKGVGKWNPELAGSLLVWRDPADGQDYVVNGHHRFDLANRLGADKLNVRYIDAQDAVEARARGALANIAEGRGTALDAAKYLRDSGQDIEHLRRSGISLSGRVAADASTLTHLNDAAFGRLARGQLDEPTALAVAANLEDPKLQEMLFKKIRDREEDGKEWGPREVATAAKKLAAAGKVTEQGQDLFGSFEDEKSTFEQEVDLDSFVSRQLGQLAGDYRAVSSERRAGRVGEAGNVLNLDENQRRRQAAEQAVEHFERQKNLKGPVADAVRAGAAELAVAKTEKERKRVRTETLDRVQQAIAADLGSGQPVATDAGTGGPGRAGDAGTVQPASGGRRPTADGGVNAPSATFSDERRSGPPGPPPRPGLVWNEQTKRWRRPETGEEWHHPKEGETFDESKPHSPAYAVSKGLSPEDAQIERNAQIHARENYPAIRDQYLKEQGTVDPATGDLKSVVMNTDEFRHLLPGYTGTNAGAVHEASSELNKKVYAEMLEKQKGKGNNRFMVLAGGGGSGKGTAVGDYFTQSDYPLVLDQVSDNLPKLEAKLDEAKKAGYTPEYVFVDRHPEDAWGGVMGRAINLRKKGKIARTVPLEVALHANVQARKTALELLKKRPDIQPNIIDNNGGDGKRRLITDRNEAIAYLEEKLAAVDEKGLKDKLKTDVLRKHAAGEIPDDIAAGFVGKEAIAANTASRAKSGPEPPRSG